MGVPVGDAEGDYVTLVRCANSECGQPFETDETTTNDCPVCGTLSADVITGSSTDPDLGWRQEYTTRNTTDSDGADGGSA